MLAPTSNDEFELADSLYSISDIQDYIEYVIKIWNINSNSSYSRLHQYN